MKSEIMKCCFKIEAFLLISSLKASFQKQETIESSSKNLEKINDLESKIANPIVVIQEDIDKEDIKKIIGNDILGEPLKKEEASHYYVNINFLYEQFLPCLLSHFVDL